MVRTTTTSLLLSLCLLPWFLTGCSDELLPPQADESVRTFYVIDRQSPGVYPIRTDGTREEKIPLPGYLVSPVSRNNRAVVVSEDNSNQIRVVDLTTGASVATLDPPEGKVISPYSVAISPDGRRVGFSAQEIVGLSINRELHLVDIDGKNRVIVDVAPGREQLLRFSHDGSQVAFFDGYKFDPLSGSIDESGELYIVSAVNGTKRKMAETDRLEADGSGQIEWSPDGKTLLYETFGSNGGVWLMDVASGTVRLLYNDHAHVAWTDDGGTIVLTTFSDLLLYDLDDLDAPQNVGASQPVLFPRALPGGKEVVGYVLAGSKDDFDIDSDSVDLARISLETGEITVIAPQQHVWYIFSAPPVE